MPITNKITPFLWFDGQAEAAARLYVSLFPKSRMLGVHPLPSGPADGAALVEFEQSWQVVPAKLPELMERAPGR